LEEEKKEEKKKKWIIKDPSISSDMKKWILNYEKKIVILDLLSEFYKCFIEMPKTFFY